MSATGAVAAETGTSTRTVFISYSRRDGTPTAHSLRHLLIKAGCDVWLDTDHIAGGASWSRVIEEALNKCHVLIAVLSEGSYVSEICRAEQMWALRDHKRVIPVLASPSAPRPLHLSTLNYRNIPAQEHELLADLGAGPLSPDSSFSPLHYDTIPPLPQNFIPREDALGALRNLVFTEGEETNIAVTTVAGMGGIGKTVLATALCRDIPVQRAFPDGIAWITIGREWDGDFVARMREAGRALGENVELGWDTKPACENRYRTILREKAALVVVDDIWNIDHLTPLLVDAPRSRFLLTTRDVGIAKRLAQRRYEANVLPPDEARVLLARSANKKVAELPPEAAGIIRECKGLAAAISQIGSSLRDVTTPEWGYTLAALEQADISAIEEQLPPGQKDFFKSLAVSIEALPLRLQERYRKLAVLLEDVPAPLLVLRTLWTADDADATRTARYFVERSLATWESATDPSSGIKLHDLQLDYVRARYPHRETLNLIHGALRLSAHVIAGDPSQFASQAIGRLLSDRNSQGMEAFLADLGKGARGPWLRPLHPALHPPGTALLRTLEGHSAWISGVALAADCKRAVSCSADKTLRVWDLESGRMLRMLGGHSATVNAVALTPDGKRAISASDDRTLIVWDPESDRPLRTLEGHSNSVGGVAITSDGRLAVSASSDDTLKAWDLESGRVVRTLEGHSNSVLAVALSASGKRAVSASSDKTLKVWDLQTGHVLHTLAGHSDSVRGVALSADERHAVSASSDNTLKVWDLESGRTLQTLQGHSASVNSVVVASNGKRAVSASDDSTVKVWDLETGRVLRTLEGHSNWVYSVALSSNADHVVSASWDRTLKVWDLKNTRPTRPPGGHSVSVRGVAIAAAGKRAISASDDKTLKVWDLENGCVLVNLEGHSDWVNSVAPTPDGNLAVSASDDKTLKVWELRDGRLLRTLAGHSDRVYSVVLDAKRNRAVSASGDRTLKLWDLRDGRVERTFAGHSDRVNSVALLADGLQAISASYDKTLKLWDLETGRVLHTFEGHAGPVYGVATSADGTRAISASADQTLKLWDLERFSALRTLAGHSASVSAAGLTADAARAVSASRDNTIKVWDLRNGVCIATFQCDASVRCCALFDRTIVAGDASGRVYFLALEE